MHARTSPAGQFQQFRVPVQGIPHEDQRFAPFRVSRLMLLKGPK